MTDPGALEIRTQKRLLGLFKDHLGYRYLGFWKDRENNSNIEETILRKWLSGRGYGDKIITKVIREIDKAKALDGGRTLYDANKDVYGLLRYGVKVKPDVGEPYKTVWLIDWKEPLNNDFAVAEEVTIVGENTKRPDIVIYVNGIALGVIELKRSIVMVSEGIRQNLDNQKKEFIRPFFTTVQFVMAGNDTEGLRYGVIETPEKYYLSWKEENPAHKPGDPPDTKYIDGSECDGGENILDCALLRLAAKQRFLQIIHDFMAFDAGIKKICRHNQFFGVCSAQRHIRRREGGIIWHTQGSGKSLSMVWLAKWIRENVQDARVLIITDREELDDQIEKVFKGVDEQIYRTSSGVDLAEVLNRNEEWLMCSLVHKFGRSQEGDLDAFLRDVAGHLPKDFHPKGELFVFVDECHRTQSGKLNDAMKAMIPGAMLIGFTGTPLLKEDKKKSIEVFGPYIHTYKYNEAVGDGVVLDLRYEARDIDQSITSQAKIDQWFELKTRGLTDIAKAQLKQRWGTMQKVLSSQDRLGKIVSDILIDMETRDRLKSGHGNAILVCSSIFQACKTYEIFQRTDLAHKCAIITSYKPSPGDIKGEESGEGQTEKLRQYEIYRRMLAKHFDEPEETAVTKVEQFEKEVKKKFINEPGQMKLLIVVDKLLTGFDAPAATYLYIDKNMQDHGLFQAICRVNRLHGEDKEYGYVIDYKDLFKSLEKSIHDYTCTGEAFEKYDDEDVAGILENRLKKGRERLEELRESVKALCEPVEQLRDTKSYLNFFCTHDTLNLLILKENEPKRLTLYKMVSSFLRAYANIANEMEQAGYTSEEIEEIKAEINHYEKVREEVKLASGDYVDLKLYEPSMRHLLDTYIRAEESEVLSAFDDMTLIELIVDRGLDALETLPDRIRQNEEAMAETIENNVRKVIIDESPANPKYYERMSELLDALIKARREAAMDYKEYLKRIVELTKQTKHPESQSTYPSSVNSGSRRALFDNLDNNVELAVGIDIAIRNVKKADWRGNRFKKLEVRNAIKSLLGDDETKIDEIFEIVKSRSDY